MGAGFADQGASAHPITILLVLVAVAAFVFSIYAFAAVLRLTISHPPFRALGIRKWVMGPGVLAYMPDTAVPYVKRYVLGFAVFMVAVLGVIAFDWLDLARRG